jgi:mRNA interferase RelE/StbE
MVVEFDSSFEKSLQKVKDDKVLKRVFKVIELFEICDNMQNILHVKKMSGFKNYYRYKLGDYRIGFELLSNQTIRFIIIAHRKEIYKKFP